MAETLQRLKGQLEHLSVEDKLELAYFLLVSLEPEDEGVAAAWDLEISRRVEDAGRSKGQASNDQ